MKICFITDRYYPNVTGGAEISLYYTIQGLKDINSISVTILALSDNHRSPTVDTINNVDVHHIPMIHDVNCHWMRLKNIQKSFLEKLYSLTETHRLKVLRLFMKGILLFRNWISYFILKTNANFSQKLSLLISNFISATSSPENIEYFDSDFRYFAETELFDRKTNDANCDLVHADNTRSILRYSESGAPFPSVAVVRDLKFFCARRRIIAHTSKGPCNECHFQCLSDLPKIQRPFIKRVFEHNLAYRQRLLKQHTKVVCTSRFLKEQLYKACGVEAVVIPNPAGINLTAPPDKPSHKLTMKRKRILFVGMLTWNKGPDIAIEIANRIIECGFDVQLDIAGRGILAQHLKNMIEDLGLQDKIKIIGFLDREKLSLYYKFADVVICPNRWPEPFGRVPLEAMVSGTVVVAFKNGGVIDTIRNGETGFLVEPGNLEELTAKVKNILSDDDLRKKMSDTAILHVEKNFSITSTVQKFIKIYQNSIK